MAKKSEVKVTTSFHLGDLVRIKDLAGQVGRIAELRGPLGPGGAWVYRVRVRRKPTVSYIELLGCFEPAGNGVIPVFELAYNSNGRSSMRKSRKHYAAVEKVAILRRHLLERVPVSDLCDQYRHPAIDVLQLAETVLRERGRRL